MSRDFDIFMSKHLAGQWLLNSYEITIYAGGETWITKNSLYRNTKNGLEKSK